MGRWGLELGSPFTCACRGFGGFEEAQESTLWGAVNIGRATPQPTRNRNDIETGTSGPLGGDMCLQNVFWVLLFVFSSLKTLILAF